MPYERLLVKPVSVLASLVSLKSQALSKLNAADSQCKRHFQVNDLSSFSNISPHVSSFFLKVQLSTSTVSTSLGTIWNNFPTNIDELGSGDWGL